MPTEVCPIGELPPGSIRQADHNGKKVAVCNVEGTIYAIADACPHRGASLSGGRLRGDTIVCPWHGSVFELATGRPRVWVAAPRLARILAKTVPPFMRKARVFDARVVEDKVVIDS